jgi:hypothetical protein
VLGLHVAKVDAYLVKADFGPKELLESVRQVLDENWSPPVKGQEEG